MVVVTHHIQNVNKKESDGTIPSRERKIDLTLSLCVCERCFDVPEGCPEPRYSRRYQLVLVPVEGGAYLSMDVHVLCSITKVLLLRTTYVLRSTAATVLSTLLSL